MRRRHVRPTRYAAVFCSLLLVSFAALGATAPPLGTTGSYGIVSDTFTNSNTGTQSDINGDVCYTTGPMTPPITITGSTAVPCAPAAGVDQGAALALLLGQPCTSLGAGAVALDAVVVGANPPGVIPPGCYSSGGAMDITLSTTVTLRGNGVYVFRPGGALNTGDNSQVTLANGACAGDVYWAPVGATTLGANAATTTTPTFVGNIIDASGITIGHFANLAGRALAFGGTVTTDAVTITVPACLVIAGPISVPVPTLSAWAVALLATLMLGFGAFLLLKRTRERDSPTA
ncbi:MAG: IPTL-CTERM sorting domain-containing protein [Betaproteobacteria bacterium]